MNDETSAPSYFHIDMLSSKKLYYLLYYLIYYFITIYLIILLFYLELPNFPKGRNSLQSVTIILDYKFIISILNTKFLFIRHILLIKRILYVYIGYISHKSQVCDHTTSCRYCFLFLRAYHYFRTLGPVFVFCSVHAVSAK